MLIVFTRVFNCASILIMEVNKPPKKRGRPPVENPASKRLPVVQVTQEQLSNYREAAELSKQKFSQWVRKSLDNAAVLLGDEPKTRGT